MLDFVPSACHPVIVLLVLSFRFKVFEATTLLL
jgi:hypothetical protein